MSALAARLAGWIINRRFQHDLSRLEEYTMTYKLMKRIIENGLKKGNLDREAT